MKKSLIVICLLLGLLLCACSENPDSSIVTNKDFDNLIDQAENAEDYAGMAEIYESASGEYENYKVSLSNEALHVSVEVDAKMEIPATDKLAVYRVRQADISQEFLDKVRTTLAPDVQFYDGSVLQIATKSDIEDQIQGIKTGIENIRNDPTMPDESKKVYLDEYNANLAELEAEYESAPHEVPLKGHESDNMLREVEELFKNNPESKYYKWMNSLAGSGDEVFYGVNDGAGGEYISLYVQNNADYGNAIRFCKSRTGYVFNSVVSVEGSSSADMWKDGEKSESMEINGEIPLSDKETLTISMEEGKALADKLLADFGMSDFACADQGKFNEIPDIRESGGREYRQVYKFTYLRRIDNTVVSNQSGMKITEDWVGDDYVKKLWPGESVVVMVNDTGIVGFYYNCPLEITEVIVDSAKMKPVDEIKSIFEEMVLISNGTSHEEEVIHLNVDRVVLRYTRISEPDVFDTGLLVPVWAFIDTKGAASMRHESFGEKNIFTVNAIDGSIIDTALGY